MRIAFFIIGECLRVRLFDYASEETQHEQQEKYDGQRYTDSQCLGGSLAGTLVFNQIKQGRKQTAHNEQQHDDDGDFDQHDFVPS